MLSEKSYEVGDEAVAVIDEFIAFHKQSDSKGDKESLNSLSHISRILTAFVFICGTVLVFAGKYPPFGNVVLQPNYRVWFLVFLLFSLIVLVAFISVEYKLSGNFLKNTELDMLDATRDVLKREATFFENLSKYSLTSLKHVQYRFNAVCEKGNSIIGLFVGFIGKTGIIPAVAIIILAIFNVGEKTNISAFEYIAFFTVIFYVLMFRLMLVIIQYKSYSDALSFYIENYRDE